MTRLEDPILKNGRVVCRSDCDNCMLSGAHMGQEMRGTVSGAWGSIYHSTYCADVLQAWQMGKLAFIDDKWYEVECANS